MQLEGIRWTRPHTFCVNWILLSCLSQSCVQTWPSCSSSSISPQTEAIGRCKSISQSFSAWSVSHHTQPQSKPCTGYSGERTGLNWCELPRREIRRGGCKWEALKNIAWSLRWFGFKAEFAWIYLFFFLMFLLGHAHGQQRTPQK